MAIPELETGTLQIPSVAERAGAASGRAANWASVRVAGEAGAMGGRRGSEEPLEASAPHSHPSPAPWASRAQRLRWLFVKRGRGSLALARPRSCLQCPQGWRPQVQTHLVQTCCCSGSRYHRRRGGNPTARSTRGPGRVPPRSSVSAPCAAASRPVADGGRGTQN